MLLQIFMGRDKYSFGVEPRMREVPLDSHAQIIFGSGPEEVETEWGTKYSFNVLLLQHPSYESIPKDGLLTKWESKSACARQVYNAYHNSKEFKEAYSLGTPWKLIRTDQGTYFLEEE